MDDRHQQGGLFGNDASRFVVSDRTGRSCSLICVAQTYVVLPVQSPNDNLSQGVQLDLIAALLQGITKIRDGGSRSRVEQRVIVDDGVAGRIGIHYGSCLSLPVYINPQRSTRWRISAVDIEQQTVCVAIPRHSKCAGDVEGRSTASPSEREMITHPRCR